ncbi:hypothetical protein [Hyphococcus sp. DH-69]|uniref:hypothetical protein n=1 Tax=Hyphococcus formosus TaxID=3143534 RepID=UPI00398B0706
MAASTYSARNNGDAIDPSRATAALERWRRAVAESLGGDPGAPLDQPDRRLVMLRVFGTTRRLADLCMTHPDAAATSLIDGPSPILAQAARDLTSLDRGVGGPEALHAALAPLKNRVDVAIAIAELNGQWGVAEATAARVDFAERMVECGLRWLVRAAVKRGELSAPDPDNFLKGVFIVAGADFAHEDLTPYGPLDLVVLYDEAIFEASNARGMDRTFVRIGAELREAFEGKPGEQTLYALRTPLGSGVGGAGYADSVARVASTAEGPQSDLLKFWLSTGRIVAGDREAGGKFLENIEKLVWSDNPVSVDSLESFVTANEQDPRSAFRGVADLCRLVIGGVRPLFRTASARDIFETAAQSRFISKDAARRLIAGEELAHIAVSRLQILKGCPAFNADRDDEQQALARLCGYTEYEQLSTVLAGAKADAVSTLRRLATGPREELAVYRSSEDGVDQDADKLEDLGFLNGPGLSRSIDRWAEHAHQVKGEKRFSACAPGLLSEFGETQYPNRAVSLFDKLLSVAGESRDVFSLVSEGAPERDGLVDALGSFSPAIAPIVQSEQACAFLFEGAGVETPKTAQEWLSRYVPPKSDQDDALSKIGAWRSELIARIAYSVSIGATSFDTAVEAINEVHISTLSKAFEAVNFAADDKTKAAAEEISLHIFESDGPYVLGAATHLGFISAAPLGEAGEGFARAYLDGVGSMCEGLFAVLPDTTHRPSGINGELVPDLKAYKNYVQSEAIAHEQIMLARGRVIAAGSEKIAESAREALRGAVACSRRADILFRDLDRARAQRMRRDRPSSDWDIDKIEGGRSDVELIISTLVYKHASAHPFVQDCNPSEALDAMARSGLLPEVTVQSLKSARAFWARLQLVRALSQWRDPIQSPVRSRFGKMLARAAGVSNFDQVRPMLRGYADEVGRAYAQVVLGRNETSGANYAAGQSR